MPNYIGSAPYITKQQREIAERKDDGRKLILSPWSVQNIVYEIIRNHMLTNDPKDCGFTFNQKYAEKKEDSQIDLAIGYNWKPDTASKRPGIFITREDARIGYPTMHSRVNIDSAESEETKLALISLPLKVSIVTTPIGFAEQLAEYVKIPLMSYAQVIQRDFCFQRFRLLSISRPQIYVEAKDNFVIELALQIEYCNAWVVWGDDLKLKTFSATIFDEVLKQPLENQ